MKTPPNSPEPECTPNIGRKVQQLGCSTNSLLSRHLHFSNFSRKSVVNTITQTCHLVDILRYWRLHRTRHKKITIFAAYYRRQNCRYSLRQNPLTAVSVWCRVISWFMIFTEIDEERRRRAILLYLLTWVSKRDMFWTLCSSYRWEGQSNLTAIALRLWWIGHTDSRVKRRSATHVALLIGFKAQVYKLVTL